jgi:hypothetical protein
LGAAFEVTGFDGWSLQSTAKTTLEMRRGVGIDESRPSRGRDETAFDEGVQTLEDIAAENSDIGKRDSDQAAQSGAIKQVARSSRTRGLRSFLAGCAA